MVVTWELEVQPKEIVMVACSEEGIKECHLMGHMYGERCVKRDGLVRRRMFKG